MFLKVFLLLVLKKCAFWLGFPLLPKLKAGFLSNFKLFKAV